MGPKHSEKELATGVGLRIAAVSAAWLSRSLWDPLTEKAENNEDSRRRMGSSIVKGVDGAGRGIKTTVRTVGSTAWGWFNWWSGTGIFLVLAAAIGVGIYFYNRNPAKKEGDELV